MKWITSLLAAFVLCACEDRSTRNDDGKVQVVATIGMIADIVRNVAGDVANVEGLVGEGVDPHLYSPTANDVKTLRDADVVFYNGLLLEGKMTDILEKVGSDKKPVIAVSDQLLMRPEYLEKDQEDHVDPHVWMDVSAWKSAVEEVETTLAVYDEGNAQSYLENSESYIAELDELDRYARKVLGSIPEGSRVLVTAHDAFGYLAKAYGLEVFGIQGLSTESEAGLNDIEALIKLLVDRKIPAVFVESTISDKNVRALVEGAAAKGQKVVIGGQLYSDAMGPAGTYEGTYIGMIDHNVTTIARALGGEAPEKGMQGKLQ